jgi:farnesyl-diphosphate farnesyltransferase
MGLFLQKTNIIRDYLEDLLVNRRFWPKEIWTKYVDDLADFRKPGYEKKAVDCLSTMILNALQHAPECLTYMNKIQNKSIFSFCAIPQVMAIATLALLFKNYNVYHSVVKIRKGETVKVRDIPILNQKILF